MYATRRQVLFYISAKYYQNIPKGIRVTERTSFSNKAKGDNSKSKKGRVVILVRDTSSRPSKYHQNIPKGIQVTERTRSFTLTPTGFILKTICPPSFGVWGVEGGGGGNNVLLKGRKF